MADKISEGIRKENIMINNPETWRSPTPEEIGTAWLIKDDERLTDVCKGYSMQAMFYSIFQEVFCTDKSCSLYNAHWQEELLNAQLHSNRVLCPRHESMLKELNNQ